MGLRRCAQFTVDPAFVIVQLMAHDLVLRDKEERLPGVFVGSAFVSKSSVFGRSTPFRKILFPLRGACLFIPWFIFLCHHSLLFYYRDVLRNFYMNQKYFLSFLLFTTCGTFVMVILVVVVGLLVRLFV